MILTAPAGLYLLLAIPVVVLLHLFRRERRRRAVSSILLWQDIREHSSRRIRPKVLRSINLLLHVLAVCVAALILSDPVLASAVLQGPQRLILLVDRSASMAVKEGSLSRMDLAKNRVRQRMSSARRDTEMMIVSMGEHPRIEQPFTTDQTLLLDTLRRISTTDERAVLSRSIDFVAALGGGSADTGVALFTDGAFDAARLPLANVEFHRVGTPQPNIAITRFELRRAETTIEAFMEIANYASAVRTVTIRLDRDGTAVAEQTVELAADESRLIAVSIPGQQGIAITATLTDADDALPADDRAAVIANQSEPVRVQLVTPGNFFLQTALDVLPDVSVTTVQTYDAMLRSDVVVYDSLPTPAVEVGNVLVVNTALEGGPFTPGETVPALGAITLQASELTAGVQLDSVEVLRVLSGRPAVGVAVHALRGPHPVLYSYRTDRLRLVGLNLSTNETDLALSPGFPVLISNIIAWLSPTRATNLIRSTRTGETFDLFLPIGIPVTVEHPDRTVEELVTTQTPTVLRGLDQAGLYTVRSDRGTTRIAANLLDAAESDLTPRFVADTAPAGVSETGGAPVGRPLWPVLLGVLLTLLAADWFIWARRT